jgi:hypothetical protein
MFPGFHKLQSIEESLSGCWFRTQYIRTLLYLFSNMLYTFIPWDVMTSVMRKSHCTIVLINKLKLIN